MTRRFITVLERSARIRDLIEREQSLPSPSAVRLIRMKRLYLRLSETLRKLIEKRLIAMASAPSFKPRVVFHNGNAGPAFSGRW